MIYCNLKGGLGNIMFQVAAAKSFSIKKGTDCSFPNFSNHLININCTKEYKKFLPLREESPKCAINNYSYPFNYINFIPQENNFIIDGFFQSEQYFCEHREEIFNFFKPSEDIIDTINTKYNFILSNNSLSIHVRRGDYINLQTHHCLQPLEYFINCVKHISEYDIIVVFSDDIQWCEENFKFKNIFFVKDEKDYIELFLMSMCKNNIISNSSFSWWGAWLNRNKNKKVIAPKNWFGPSLKHLDTHDLYPSNWILL